MGRFYGHIDENGNIHILNIFRDSSYDLTNEEGFQVFLNDINQLDSDCKKLGSMKKELESEIDTLKKLHEKFMEDKDSGITCFDMIRSTLITLYEKLYGEKYG